jgi:hypothetical protein
MPMPALAPVDIDCDVEEDPGVGDDDRLSVGVGDIEEEEAFVEKVRV